jgi:DNA repair exonuclease SbcCD nuclease subunit
VKVLFVADLHINLRQKGVPIEWARNRYKLFREQLVEQCKQADVLVFGGDVFDRHPNTEEIAEYVSIISVIPIPTYIIPGNHEALKKSTTFLTHLKEATQQINPKVVIIDDYFTTSDGILDFLPYNKLKEYHPADVDFHARILVTHVRGEIPPHVKPEVPLDIFERWDVVLAGDLHSYENSQLNILYPGSPMTTSFHRNHVKTGAILLDTDTLEHEWLEYKLPQLIRKTIQVGEIPEATDFDLTLYEVEGDLAELAGMETHALIDKKISKRESDVALILDPSMTIDQELSEYLTYIMQLPNTTVKELMEEFNASNASNSLQ